MASDDLDLKISTSIDPQRDRIAFNIFSRDPAHIDI